MTDQNEALRLAQLAYAAYGQSTGGKNYQGLPMPQWDDLGDKIQQAWIAATNAILDDLMGIPATDA